MSVNDLLSKVARLEAQQKSTEAGAILIDAVDAIVQSGEFPEGIGLILLRIGLNFIGTDLEPNGIESIGDGIAQLHADSKNLKKSLELVARFLFDVVIQVGQAGYLEVAQNVMKVAFPLVEKVKFKDTEVLTPIVTQAVLSTLSGKVPEAQKFTTAATEINQRVKSFPVSLLLQFINAMIAYQNKDYRNFLNEAQTVLEEAAKKENYHIIALIAGMIAKAFTSAGRGNDACLWWATAEVAAGMARLKKFQAFSRDRKKEIERILSAKTAVSEAKKAPPPQTTSPIIPRSPFGDDFSPLPSPPITPAQTSAYGPPATPILTTTPPAGGGSRKEELYHQIESVKALIKDIDDALPTASDPGALRQQKTLMRKKLRELQEEHDKFP